MQKCHIFASRLNSTTRACLLYGRLILLLPSCHCTASASLRTLHLTTSCGAVSDVPDDTVAKALTIPLSAFITDSRYYLLSASCRQASAARRGALQCCLKHFALGHHMRMPSTAQRRVFGAAVLVITLVLLALLMAQRYISPAAMHRSNATHKTSHVVPEELSMHAFCNITGDKRRIRQGLLETLLGTIALLKGLQRPRQSSDVGAFRRVRFMWSKQRSNICRPPKGRLHRDRIPASLELHVSQR